jgi:hypothetical protein
MLFRRKCVPLECSELMHELVLSPVPANACHNSFEEPFIVESTQTSIVLSVASMRMLLDVCTATVISRHLCLLRSLTLQRFTIHRLDELELAAQHELGLPPHSYYHQLTLVAALSIPSFSSRRFVHCHTGFDVHCESAVLLEGIVQHVLGLDNQLVCVLSVRVYSRFCDIVALLLGPISMLHAVASSARVWQLTNMEKMCTAK